MPEGYHRRERLGRRCRGQPLRAPTCRFQGAGQPRRLPDGQRSRPRGGTRQGPDDFLEGMFGGVLHDTGR